MPTAAPPGPAYGRRRNSGGRGRSRAAGNTGQARAKSGKKKKNADAAEARQPRGRLPARQRERRRRRRQTPPDAESAPQEMNAQSADGLLINGSVNNGGDFALRAIGGVRQFPPRRAVALQRQSRHHVRQFEPRRALVFHHRAGHAQARLRPLHRPVLTGRPAALHPAHADPPDVRPQLPVDAQPQRHASRTA